MDNFMKTFTSYLGDDLVSFSTSFPMVLTFSIVGVGIISMIFRKGKDTNFEDILESDSSKYLKKTLKILRTNPL